MEYVEGRTLREILDAGEDVPADQLLRFGLQICDGQRTNVIIPSAPGKNLLSGAGIAGIVFRGVHVSTPLPEQPDAVGYVDARHTLSLTCLSIRNGSSKLQGWRRHGSPA